ncbi:complement component C1q receptor-like [Varanus komodoensis]|uniref:complement component C1q receptor-like n=1 Tax=Varanus komodoensis TaxID=61221 RepID=UPI001CF7AEF3|nr:complement component C1q receptor-like [Varanus komodoensis]
MGIILHVLWRALLCGLTVQPSEAVEVLCAGTACYTLDFGRHTWSEAQQKCQDNGGNLVTLKSQDEALLVRQLLAKMPAGETGPDAEVRLWIGLHREKGKCYQQHRPLRGFSWVTGGEEGHYADWRQEPRETCTADRCVALQGVPSAPQQLAWADGHCGRSAAGKPGYLCKFSFQGTCRPLVLAGPGTVRYTTPFGVTTASLAAVPFGSSAEVLCGEEALSTFLVCKPQTHGNSSRWSSPGPFCASRTHGCGYSNGGCEHTCLDGPGGSFRCACQAGYRLGGDRLSCVLVDYCSSNPCQGQCVAQPGGFQCLCAPGYRVAEDGLSCVDVDECTAAQPPCEQTCINTPGSFTCQCGLGFTPAGPDGQACQDVDECAEHAPCEQLCTNTEGSFHCYCRPGYQLEGVSGSACLDMNECQEEYCEHMCSNQLGSYECSCRPGWVLAPDGFSCLLSAMHSTSAPPGQQGEPWSLANTSPTAMVQDLVSKSSVQAQEDRSSVSLGSTSPPPVFNHPQDAENHVISDGVEKDSGASKYLPYYILGGLALFLLVAAALSWVFYRRMKDKKDKEKTKSATDKYCWEPDQGEARAGKNEYI